MTFFTSTLFCCSNKGASILCYWSKYNNGYAYNNSKQSVRGPLRKWKTRSEKSKPKQEVPEKFHRVATRWRPSLLLLYRGGRESKGEIVPLHTYVVIWYRCGTHVIRHPLDLFLYIRSLFSLCFVPLD